MLSESRHTKKTNTYNVIYMKLRNSFIQRKIRSLIVWGKGWQGLTEVMKIFCVLITLVLIWLCTFVNS